MPQNPLIPTLAAPALLAASLALGLSAPALAQVEAPRVAITDLAQLPSPLPLPYDETADAEAAVAAAFARAKAGGKRVLIDLGGNWCPDCRILAGMMELPEVKPFLEAHYAVVTVDVGRMNKNLQIPQRFGIEKLRGVPTVLVVEADGTLVNKTDSAELADARSKSPQAIVDWLARYAAPVKAGTKAAASKAPAKG